MNEQQIPLHTVSQESDAAGLDGPERDALPDAFLHELTLKHLFRLGELRLYDIAQRLALGTPRTQALLDHLRARRLVEVPRRGDVSGDVSFCLTEAGGQQARAAMEKSQYVGPSPVTLDEYTVQVGLQSRRPFPTTAPLLKSALGNMVLDPALLPTLGSALNSGKAIYLYGPSGCGKTYLAEHLVRTLQGQIWVPHAIYVDGETIQVFDPTVHQPLDASSPAERSLRLDFERDARWVRCARPVVMTGGELTLQMLELDFDSVSHRYVAPPQIKANNGIFVVDDFGRQRVRPAELLNRWIIPLDRHIDFLGLRTGLKFEVPFDVTVIFSSNFAPDELTDAAFSRRIGYKIGVGALDKTAYRIVAAQACQRAGLEFDRDAIDFMIDELHPASAQPYLPCIPYDVISKVRDRSLYLAQPTRLSPALLAWAWNVYFGLSAPSPEKTLQIHGLEKAEK